MFLNAPFTDDQVKSINTFQRIADLFSVMKCSCGGVLYATEEGLSCKSCSDSTEIAPLFVTNWSWNKFHKKKDEDDGDL